MHAIHAFLTDKANNFSYSLSTEPGNSGDDLVDFLRLRRGFCEQYAGAMAVLVRAAGVPARMALGYTPGEEQRDGSRLITTDDAHAWVEVYFQGLGWVPFDPTPISTERAVDLPWAPRADAATGTDVGQATAVPSAPAAAAPTTRQDRASDAAATANRGAGRRRDVVAVARRRGPGARAAVSPVAPAARPGAAAPAPARGRDHRRPVGRTGGHGRSTWACGCSRPGRRGVRRRSWREAVARGGDRDGRAADAVARLARAEEAACYGRAAGTARIPELVTALRTARQGLLRSAARDVRLRALLWPASLVTGAGARLSEAASGGGWVADAADASARTHVRRRPVLSGCRAVGLLVVAAAEALLEAVLERLAAHPAPAAGPARGRRTAAGAGGAAAGLDRAGGGLVVQDGEGDAAEASQGAEGADEEGLGDRPTDEHGEPDDDQDGAELQLAARLQPAVAGADGRGELGIVIDEGALDLLQQTLLVLGERHVDLQVGGA